jgi:hypothetical protein
MKPSKGLTTKEEIILLKEDHLYMLSEDLHS